MRLLQFSANDRHLLKRFVRLPFDLYKDSPYWVAPLRSKQRNMIRAGTGMQLQSGPFVLFLLEKEGRDVARVLAGVNRTKNQQRGLNDGYFSLFECTDDPVAARQILSGALGWLRQQGVERVTGPVSPTNGDDMRGILVAGNDQMPSINTTYTMPYYGPLLEQAGFKKYLDFHALKLVFDTNELVRIQRIVEYGRNKRELDVRKLNLKDTSGEVKAIHRIIIEAAQAHWEHLELPTEHQIRTEFEELRKLIDPNLIMIARIRGEPVGFVAGIPDYNQVLCHLNGRLTLLTMARFIHYKKRITRVRMFMQFVLPKFQNTFVTPTLYLKLYEAFQKGGYLEMEGSTIAESNLASLAAIRGVGFTPSRIYRIYQQNLSDQSDPSTT